MKLALSDLTIGGVPALRWRSRRVVLASKLAALAIVVLAGTACLSSDPPEEQNSFTAGVLGAPAAPATVHPNVTGTGDGNVKLTWTENDTLAHPVTLLVQRAPASSPTSWTTINGGGSGQSSSTLCSGSPPGTLSCSYTDTSATYNSQYVFQVIAQLGGWSETSGPDLAQSLKSTNGTEYDLADPSLNSVSAHSATSIWAVGADCTIDYYNGTSWTPQSVPSSVCPSGTSLNGVDFDGGSPVVVGSGGVTFMCSSSCTTSSPTWTAGSSGVTVNLSAVSAYSSGYVWAVGADCTVLYSSNGGQTWTRQTVSTIYCPSGTTLNSVAQNYFDPVVAGNSGVLFTCTSSPCNSSTPTWTTDAITGLSGSPDLLSVGAYGGYNTVVAVGAAGTIATCTSNCAGAGETWHTMSSGTTAMLTGASVTNGLDGFAVGSGGTILECTTSCNTATATWSSHSISSSVNLSGIAALGSNSAWTVGSGATIYADNGGTFTSQASNLSKVATQYTLSSTDLADLSAPDSSRYTDQAPWPSTALGSTCTASTPGLLLTPSPTVPSGSWTIGTVQATIVYQANTTPGTGAVFQLLVSPDAGNTWTAYALTKPGTNGASVTQTLNIAPTINTTSVLQSMKLCIQGSSGSGPALTTSIDLAHVDVN